MKRAFACILVCVLLMSSFCVSANAAADFEVQDGVLVKYNGTAADVALPGNVFAIGAEAFLNNTNIRSVTLPSSVYSIGERAFYGCTALTTVSGGDNVAEVGDLAFRSTPYLENSTTKYFMLGHVLLWYNGTAESVSIPTSCTAVASYAFMRCDYLRSFTAYEGLISIGTGAFYGCSRLGTVNLPSTVSDVGAYAFDGTPYLSSLGTFAVVGDGVLVRYSGSDTDVSIPDTVTRIAPHAFTGSKLRSVTVPESVYEIDALAFADCTGLAELEMNDGLVIIGDSAFRGCKSLGSVTTPETLSYIGQKAFSGSSLKGIGIRGENVTVSYNAFKGCTALSYALLSDGVASVCDNAFDGCTALGGVSVSVESGITAAALSNCGKVTVCCDENAPAKTALASFTVNTLIGDADSDGEVSVMDATRIQYYLAHLETLSGAQTAISDVNFDGEINILDAHGVQLHVAKLA